MTAFSLMFVLAAAKKLAFSDLCIKGADFFSSFAPYELRLSDTAVKLDDDGYYDCAILIEGLGDTEYLCCFREDQMIFPNTPQDQHVAHQIEVFDGDEFIWFKFRGIPPQQFLNAIFPLNGLKPRKEDLMVFKSSAKFLASFNLKQNVSLASNAASRVTSVWSRCNCPILIIVSIIFATAFILAIIYTLRLPRHHAVIQRTVSTGG